MKTKSSVQQCCPALHESLASFNWAGYPKGFFAHIAFLAPRNELLLVADGAGGWRLPSERLLRGCVLLNSPARVHEEVLGGRQYCQLNDGPGRQIKILDSFEEDEAFHVVILAHVTRQSFGRWRFATKDDVAELALSGSAASLATEKLMGMKMPGWNKEKVAVAA